MIRSLLPPLLILGLGIYAPAQIPISGNIFNGSGGPLLANTLYLATGSLTIPLNQTLTIQAGAIIKFQNPGAIVSILGTLNVQGMSGSPVTFTDWRDDSVGGDTNGNGPSSGGADWWQGLSFSPTSGASTVNYAVVKYTGWGFTTCVSISGSNPTLQNCTMAFGNHGGLSLNNSGALPTIANCTIQNCGGAAIRGVPLDAVPGFSNNSAINNTFNVLEVVSSTMTANRTISPANGINGVLYFPTADLVIPNGRTLTLQAGVICKFNTGRRVVVGNATLITNGTPTNPVVFTDFRDDSHGGDTNTNGLSTGGADWWQGLLFSPGSDASVINNALVRYTGWGFTTCVTIQDSAPSLQNSVFDLGNHGGISLLNSGAFPSVTNCTVQNCGGLAIRSVPIDAVPGFANNTAIGNGTNALEVGSTTMTANRTISPQNGINGVLYFQSINLAIPTGRTLTLAAGVILKFNVGLRAIVANATLVANGTQANPVVFTDWRDDAYGGDTNTNGVSAGGADWWQGLLFNPGSDASVLNNAIVRYTGHSFTPCISISGANPVLERCTMQFGNHGGLSLNNIFAQPSISLCNFLNNGGSAVRGVPLDSVPGFLHNTATGNGGNFIDVTSTNLIADRKITKSNCMGGSLMFSTINLIIPAGRKLRLEPGVVMKFQGGFRAIVNGALDVKGIGSDPVVFTDFRDDAYGGDTNNNGASTGAADWWQGLIFPATAEVSTVEHLIVRYTGWGFTPSIDCASSSVTLRSVRADHGNHGGIVATAHSGFGDNWVSFRCNSFGIRLTGAGAPSLRHPTVFGGNAFGIQSQGAYAGMIQNGISWGNTTNYSGFTGTTLQNCNGLASAVGVNGNINSDPLFVDAAPAVGNLRLNPGSPCLGTAATAPALAVGKDHIENSRLLDHALTGSMLADMGAFELPAYVMNVTGTPAIGDTLTFTVTGPPGVSLIAFGDLDSPPLPLPPYGMITLGDPATILIVPSLIPTGSAFPISIATNPSLVGLELAAQTITTPNPNPAVGNLSNVYRAFFRF